MAYRNSSIPIFSVLQSKESYIDSQPILQSWHYVLLSDMVVPEKNGLYHL